MLSEYYDISAIEMLLILGIIMGFLFVISIMWTKRNGKNDKLDKKVLGLVAVLRCLSLVISVLCFSRVIYLMSLTSVKPFSNEQTEFYVKPASTPDGEFKYLDVNCIKSYRTKICKDADVYDKAAVLEKINKLDFMDTMFRTDLKDSLLISKFEFIENTETVSVDCKVNKFNDSDYGELYEVDGLFFSGGSLKKINPIAISGIIKYDLSLSQEDGIITNYALVNCSYKEEEN
jgi:hypothetical protein